jgi:hypothetical protein
MATLNLTPEEFADISLLFLADKAVNPEKVALDNPHFNKFMEKNAPQIKNKLLKYYLDADPERRREYKMIKKVFTNPNAGLQIIRIGPPKVIKGIRKKKSKVKELIKKLVRKALKLERIEQDEVELIVEFLEEEE